VRIGVLSNLRAGENDTNVSRMLAFLKRHPDIVHVELDTDVHVSEALTILRQQGVEILAVNGGDGTLQRVLTEILSPHIPSPRPLIAPLRGGRTNMTTLDIGSHRSPMVALSTILKSICEGSVEDRIVKRPVLRVNLGPGLGVQYGMFFGAGAIHRTIELKHRILPKRHFQGVLGSGAFVGTLVARAVFGSLQGLLTPDSAAMWLDNQSLKREEYLLVMATTLRRLFLNIQPFWGQEAAPIRFTAISANAPRSLIAAVKIVCGYPPARSIQKAGYMSRNVHQAMVQLDCGVIIDGELFAPQPGRIVRIETDRRIRFVRS
jgi:diacylglycerol kinase (ATP)